MKVPNYLRNIGIVLPAMILVMAGLTAAAVPAQAAHVTCGAVITTSTTLDSNLGPCPGDGLIITAGNITLDLGGHTIYAANGAGDNAGVRLVGVSGVFVRNGTVTGFDAGVFIDTGSGNTLTGLTARDNINDMGSGPCDLGDGIAIRDSAANTVTLNSIAHNGPYGGVSVIGNSDNNVISFNQITNNNVTSTAGSGCGQPAQDVGVRLEGPGANGNLVDNNTVAGSLLTGISLHGYICASDPATSGNVISRNSVRGTAGATGDGIAILRQGSAGVVCPAYGNTIERNTSSDNQGFGIYLAPGSHDNTVNRNVVNGNNSGGLHLDGPVITNQFTNVGPTLLDLVSPDRAPYVQGTDYRVMSGSGSGDITARLVAIDIALSGATAVGNPNPVDTSTSGCEQADYAAAGFQPGNMALLQRGTCTFVSKVNLAIANGASAVVMFNEGQVNRTSATFGSVGPVSIPVLSTSYSVGFELYNLTLAGPVTIHVVTNTTNVSVESSPGAHDNALSRNSGAGNTGFDGFDGTLSPPCDNNRWQRNEFGTVNQLCVAAGGPRGPRVSGSTAAARGPIADLGGRSSRGGPSTSTG